jgi:hypothetical protein
VVEVYHLVTFGDKLAYAKRLCCHMSCLPDSFCLN